MNVRKLWPAVLLAVWGGLLPALEISSGCPIVLPSNPTPPEQYAAEMTARVLSRSLGGKFPVVASAAAPRRTGPAILINPAPGKDACGLEEWTLRVDPAKNIVIGGNRMRGVLYGAYEFLERYAGYRHLALDCEMIPSRRSITVPDDLDLKGRPFFPYRRVSMGIWGETFKHSQFLSHNRQLNDSSAPRWGYCRFTGSPGSCHTFWQYSADFPQGHDEYFSLGADGRRQKPVNGLGPGQMCLSNPEVRTLVAAGIIRHIKADREKTDRETPGAPYYSIYDLSQNDNTDYCRCPGCEALAARYGGQSGAMLDFVNAVAREVGRLYPEVMIQTFAYQYTLPPPKNIKAEPNVMICIANMGTEWSNGGWRESMRSLNHPSNRKALELLEAWAGVSDHLEIWDYGLLYHDSFPSPQVMVRALFDNFKVYRRLGVKHVYYESEVFVRLLEPQNFCDLKNYAYARLSIDPDLDGEALIGEFMTGYFGPAAPPMLALLNELEKRQNAEPGDFGAKPVQMREYLDAGLFLKAEELLTEAEQLAAGHPEILARIGQERYAFDFARLKLEDKLFPRHDFPVSREETIARLKRASRYLCEKYFAPDYYDPMLARDRMIERDATRISLLSDSGAIPDQFKTLTVVADYPWQTMVTGVNDHMTIESDPEAYGGKTARYLGFGEYGDHTKPFEFGIYDQANDKHLGRLEIPRSEVPADEKYHWYTLENVRMTSAKCRMWAHWSWHATPADISGVFNPLEPDRRYDFHFSLKLTGPDYVPGSTSKNSCSIDRIIVTRSPEIKPPPLPKELAGIEVVRDFTWPDFTMPSGGCVLVRDDDAALGKAAQYICASPEYAEKPFAFGAYDNKTGKILASKTLDAAETPQDGKYHWYKLSGVRLTPDVRFFGHWDWKLTPMDLNTAFNPEHPERVCDIYLSAKLEDGAFVKGSGRPGKASIDRVIVVLSKPGKKQ